MVLETMSSKGTSDKPCEDGNDGGGDSAGADDGSTTITVCNPCEPADGHTGFSIIYDPDPIDAPKVESQCTIESFFLGANFVLDLSGAGELLQGGKALIEAGEVMFRRGVVRLALRVLTPTPARVAEWGEGVGVGAEVGIMQNAAEGKTSTTDMLRAVRDAFIPLKGTYDSAKGVGSACNPE